MTIAMARLAALIVYICLCVSAAHAQSASNPNREQRELLHAVVLAVDAATSQSETLDAAWQTHVMRASDGSHYLAFIAQPSAAMPLPAGPALLYVRLANATPSRLGERSQIREWLAGTRTAPPPIARSGIAIGEMPIFGPTGNLASTAAAADHLRNDGPGAYRSGETTGTGEGRRTGTPAPRRARREDRGRGRGRPVRRLRSRVALDRRRWRARDLARAHDGTRRLRAVRRLGRSVRTQARVDHSGDEEVDSPAAGIQ